MPLALPVVTKLSASTNTMVDYMAAIRTHMATSTKFSVVANGPTDDAFTLIADDADEVWHLNFRRENTTICNITLDPIGNVTAPGTAGDGGDASPTLTDATEESGEFETLAIQGSSLDSLDFYLIELDDCLIILFMNAAEDYTPRAAMLGRTWIPFYSDGVNGDNYADGLGIHGPVPASSNSSGTTHWFASNTTQSVMRGHQTGWFAAGLRDASPGNNAVGRINGQERPRPADILLHNTDGGTENAAGYTKYLLWNRFAADAGDTIDTASDGWVFIDHAGPTSVNWILPWDRLITPAF